MDLPAHQRGIIRHWTGGRPLPPPRQPQVDQSLMGFHEFPGTRDKAAWAGQFRQAAVSRDRGQTLIGR